MRKVKEVLRLRYDLQLSYSQIRRSCGISNGSLNGLLTRAAKLGLTGWAQVRELSEEALEKALFRRADDGQWLEQRPLPDWTEVERELRRHKHLTLKLVWGEYLQANPGGYGFSQFCELFRRWRRGQGRGVTMRQDHRPGDTLQVDYAGDTVVVMDHGQVREAQIFVACLPFSGLIYAEATWSQQVEDWLGAHVRALGYLGGVPGALVPDNLKSGVTRAHAYEPHVNRTYEELAHHYGAVVIPTRVARPKDKPKAEVSVQIAQRWILAALRHHTFFALADLNAAIRVRVDAINGRPMKAVGVSRRVLFEQLDRPALRPLPTQRYELAEWKPCRVNIDYHVEVAHNYYSVPYQLVHAQVETRATASTVEIFAHGRRVASHQRLTGRGRFSTQLAHMPHAHRAHAEWTPSRLIAWAEQSGPATGRFVAGLLERRPHPEQGYRACLGLMRLGRTHGANRLEAACRRAEQLQSYRYRTVEHVLTTQQDRLPLDEPPARPPVDHDNLRGAAYYEETYADPSHD